MNLNDGLNKQLNGRSLQGKNVLEGSVWLFELHKAVGGFNDMVTAFAEGSAVGDEALTAFLTKVQDASRNLLKHISQDQSALKLLTDISSRRKPEDTDVNENAPDGFAPKDTKRLMNAMVLLEKKVQDCGLRDEAWKESGIQTRLMDILDEALGIRSILEGLAGDQRVPDKDLDDKLFEVHFAATSHIGNKHLETRADSPSLIKAIGDLLKRMRREMMLVKAVG